ncbi:MAG: lipoyl synthase [Ilumatobacteraceae bacterium]
MSAPGPLHARWLGRVPYREALALQHAVFEHGVGRQHLLLLEHPHVFTHGPRADLAKNVLVEPASVGAELVAVNRGGDVTYHGPGQLVGYPILSLAAKYGRGNTGLADAVAYVHSVEQLIIDTLAAVGLTSAGRLREYPGVWVDPDGPAPRKICAIGVRLSRGRTMHGFALNLTTDMRYLRDYIIPCGSGDRPVTSLAEEGFETSMQDVAAIAARLAADRWAGGELERHDVAWKHAPGDLSAFSRGEGAGTPVRRAEEHGNGVPVAVGSGSPGTARMRSRLESAGVTEGLAISTRKPEWLRPKVKHDPSVIGLRNTLRELDLVTVCEEAGCPNLSECWSDGTATFMILGERCTRACGFCLVDTRKPLAPDADEPARVAEAVERLALDHAVVTMVARDDLADGGAAAVAATIEAIRSGRPAATIEVLVSDFSGSLRDVDTVVEARPDVYNHNIETVPRLQRAVRPSAGYARSLATLSHAKSAGLTTKSGLVIGMGETDRELEATLVDLASIGVDIVTIGQYLRPTSNHLPVARWVEPATFEHLKRFGESIGIGHVESSPLTRSSYHAKSAAAQAGVATPVSLR